MRALSLAFKNIRANPSRSFALGSFVLISSVIFVLFNSFVFTITGNMNDALVNALSGDIQIRPAASKETDMLSMKQGWSGLPPFTEHHTGAVMDALGKEEGVQVIKRVRQSVLLTTNAGQEAALVIGLDPNSAIYQKALMLSEGRYLDPGKSNEIVISKGQAKKLKVGPGDTVEVMVALEGQVPKTRKLQVVGIGELKVFNMFGIFFAYTDLGSVQNLMGYKADEVTDVIAYLPQADAATFADRVRVSLGETTSGPRDFEVTTRDSMGGFIMGGINLYSALLYGFIAILLLIVGLLIMNLVYMIGIERRREIGTLRALGFSRGLIVVLFVSEITFIATVFSAIGVLAGGVVVKTLSTISIKPAAPLDFVMGKEFYMQFNWWQVLSPLVVISVFTLFASLLPSYQAASLRPVELMAEK
ncbi:MAG TPA: FtsX-like permease family protein [Symbiobacteriaceae bacterium]|jgi:putative ABC transport system permease protein